VVPQLVGHVVLLEDAERVDEAEAGEEDETGADDDEPRAESTFWGC
jgi:hypothetical protein